MVKQTDNRLVEALPNEARSIKRSSKSTKLQASGRTTSQATHQWLLKRWSSWAVLSKSHHFTRSTKSASNRCGLPPGGEHQDWLNLRGDRQNEPRLLAHCEARIERESVGRVVQDPLKPLAQGILSVSMHGLLRLAHALRSWSRGAAGSLAVTGRDRIIALQGPEPMLYVDGTIGARAAASTGFAVFTQEVTRVDMKVCR